MKDKNPERTAVAERSATAGEPGQKKLEKQEKNNVAEQPVKHDAAQARTGTVDRRFRQTDLPAHFIERRNKINDTFAYF